MRLSTSTAAVRLEASADDSRRASTRVSERTSLTLCSATSVASTMIRLRDTLDMYSSLLAMRAL
jgi:hypothetical protein